MEQWLIRTRDNILAGPYSKKQVQDLITAGQLAQQDEVCPANGYWFFLYEVEEVQQHLQVNVRGSASVDPDEEVTDTQTTLRPDEDVTPVQALMSQMTGGSSGNIDGTTVLSSKRKRGSRNSTPAVSGPLRLPSIERPSFIRNVSWVLISVAALLIIAILRIIRSN